MKKLPNRIKKAKLTPDGEKVLQALQSEYGMTREAALKLMHDGGTLLAMAMLARSS